MSFVVKQGFLLSLILIPHKRIRCDPLLVRHKEVDMRGGCRVVSRETEHIFFNNCLPDNLVEQDF